MNTILLIKSYGAVTAVSGLLAFALGRNKGVSGIKLLFGALMLALSWPIWATGAVILSMLGLALAIVGLLAVCLLVACCVVGFLWLVLLLKCIELLGWVESTRS